MDEQRSGSKISRGAFVFGVTLAVWLLFTWPFAPIEWPMIIAGALVAILSGVLLGEMTTRHPGRGLNPVRYFWGACYIFVLAWWVAMANLDVAFRVLHPDVPINPGIVKVKTDLKSESAKTALANSITLTPGTMTVDLSDDGHLYVHWINVSSTDVEEATHQVVGRFEPILRRIFE
ncbi:MAG: Na+/H+ antiporter subunit E [Candidatus Bipolaricaulota bacterium]